MAALEVLRSNIATHNATSPVGAPLLSEASGQRRNEKVTQLNSPSKLLDAAEEMGLAVSSKLDRKSLETRSVRQGQGSNLEAINRIAEYYDKLPDLPDQDKLRDMIAKLKDFQSLLEGKSGGGSGISQQDLLDILSEFDGDITHQFAALEIAIEHFEATGDSPELLQSLRDTHKAMQEGTQGREIRAGFAVAQLAHDNAEEFGTNPEAIREHYHTMLRNEPDFAKIFDSFTDFIALKQTLGKTLNDKSMAAVDSFDDVIDLFTQAAGRGLELAEAGDEPAQLQGILVELGKLKSMRTVYEGVDSALMLTNQNLISKQTDDKSTLDKVAGKFFQFISKSVVGPVDAQAIVTPIMPVSAKDSVVFANNIINLHRDVPDTIISSDSARVQQQGILTEMSEHLALKEEEQFQAQLSAGE
ncbi:HrpJ domain-containing protein [Polycladidibacter stylochi]|uniref:HrpJ domain-containing protein n=1 Tax=Polycladidibacter stylochi TaxID=1807766 RepID=UPI00082BE5DD|nr:HrpJ domain-containing protein [Pseudovibrio stylochi]